MRFLLPMLFAASAIAADGDDVVVGTPAAKDPMAVMQEKIVMLERQVTVLTQEVDELKREVQRHRSSTPSAPKPVARAIPSATTVDPPGDFGPPGSVPYGH